MRTVICLFTVSIYLAFNPFVHPAVADGDELGAAIDTKTQDEPRWDRDSKRPAATQSALALVSPERLQVKKMKPTIA